MNEYSEKGSIKKGEQEQERINSLKAKRDRFLDKYKNWIDSVKDINIFLRGVHSEDALISRRTGKEEQKLPEDFNHVTGKLYSKLDYTLSRCTEMVQYIRSDEGEVLVQTEGKYSMEQGGDPSLMAIGALFPELTDSERTAKLLTARLDLLNDRSDMQKSLQKAAMVAASQRMAFCVMKWVEDEAEIEPLQLDVLKVGHYWFDPEADSVKSAKYLGYQESGLDVHMVESEYGVDLSEACAGKKEITIEHYYCRDFTTETREMQDTESGLLVRDTIYKYPYAWRYTVVVKGAGVILYDGEMQSPSGLPPVCIFTWDKLPQSMIGVSVVDKTRGINEAVDRCVEVIQKSAWRMVPKIPVDTAALEDPDDLDEGEAGGYLKFNALDGPITNSFGYIPAAAAPDGVYRLADWLIQRGDEMLGVSGLNATDLIKSDLSGDAIEGIAQSQDGKAGKIRDEWYTFLKEVYTLAIRFYMANERQDIDVKISTPTGQVSINMNLSRFGFNDKDFESNFDVSVFSPRNMPKNPVKRADYIRVIVEQVVSMTAMNPDAARIYVENADLPNKQELLSFVEAEQQKRMIAMQQQLQQAEAEPAAVDTGKNPIEEAALQRANDAAKSVGDSLEKLSNELAKAGDLLGAAEVTASIPQKMNEAYAQIMQGSIPTTSPNMEIMQ